MTAKKDKPGYRKNTTDPHPLFGGNPSQYTNDVEHRPESDEETEAPAPAEMAQQGRWTRK